MSDMRILPAGHLVEGAIPNVNDLVLEELPGVVDKARGSVGR